MRTINPELKAVLPALAIAAALVVFFQVTGGPVVATTTPAAATPVPAFAPGAALPDRAVIERQELRDAIGRIPDSAKQWIGSDVVVYLLPRDPHDLSGPKLAVAHDLPTATALNFDGPGRPPFAERGGSHPAAVEALARMKADPQLKSAVDRLLREAN